MEIGAIERNFERAADRPAAARWNRGLCFGVAAIASSGLWFAAVAAVKGVVALVQGS